MSEHASPEEYAEELKLLIRHYDASRPRSRQSAEHRLGVSDVGGCPQYAVLMIRQAPFTDAPDPWAAVMGTAVHHVTEQARAFGDPDVITDAELTVTMPNGVELTGHPDAIDQRENSITDDKSVDGVGVVRRAGPEDKQRWQVAMYAKGAVDAGLLEPDPLIRLVWLDRSGKDSDPVVWQKVGYDEEIVEATEWLDDVIYHVQHQLDADKTPSIEWCAKACPFYTGCRLEDGDLPNTDTEITDDAAIRAVSVYLEGRDLKKEATSMMESAKAELDGHVGVADIDGHRIRVRWTSVNTSHVEAYERAGYRKLDVREVPKKDKKK